MKNRARRTIVRWNATHTKMCALSVWENSCTILLEWSTANTDFLPSILRDGVWKTMRAICDGDTFRTFDSPRSVRKFIRKWTRRQDRKGRILAYVHDGIRGRV